MSDKIKNMLDKLNAFADALVEYSTSKQCSESITFNEAVERVRSNFGSDRAENTPTDLEFLVATAVRYAPFLDEQSASGLKMKDIVNEHVRAIEEADIEVAAEVETAKTDEVTDESELKVEDGALLDVEIVDAEIVSDEEVVTEDVKEEVKDGETEVFGDSMDNAIGDDMKLAYESENPEGGKQDSKKKKSTKKKSEDASESEDENDAYSE